MDAATDIKYLKGIGPVKAALLGKELGIKTVGDLLEHYPTSYVDRSQVYKIADLRGAELPMIQVRGRFLRAEMQGEGAKSRLVALFTDGTGVMEVVWFRQCKSIAKSLNPDLTYVLFGKPSEYNHHWQLVHPELDTEVTAETHKGLRGVYPLTEGLRNKGVTSRQMHTWVVNALTAGVAVREILPAEVLQPWKLMSRAEAIRVIHRPQNMIELERAKFRLKFEELFFLELNIIRYGRNRKQALKGWSFTKVGSYFNRFYSECMPFELTNSQKRVIKEIRSDMNTGRQMNRLLQGDVGSGKTLVALLTMLIALDNGAQACMMAPTEILATQHYETLSALAGQVGVNVKLLTGSTPKKEREEIHRQLMDGSLHILIGTHAVIEDNVQFARLGYVVIDEQHRFGVAQRARLWQKAEMAPHVLVMTATPIPRTLAMTVYGDLDVSIIDELPPGRKPVTTVLRYDDRRQQIYDSLHRQLLAGRQAYIVYPLIDENEKLDLRSLENGYEFISHLFKDFKVAMVHGRMKPAEKDRQMQKFVLGEAHILVATTVIEVGVNVPNASVMIIENAERFGLSQLHQLRGRVGRGADQSYCILMSKHNIGRDTRHRLEVMTSTTDGFVVAEEDMKLRGPGDIEGTMQSGLFVDLKMASLVTDTPILEQARRAAEIVLDADPRLSAHPGLRQTLSLMFDRTMDWARIS
ncbi:MAG: ATP-dependent DNA helicase RecG [Bacteroides sp.]|nr:ATP-dependent DNA helicase RecG [Bacteroides sp.]MCM1378909.1 ATP-dependent DNA helicase RecG [Bacteroides sp.]MCM1445525.1 ATP-dependent DNA helicase RecG [Prevotella sp.]